MVLPDVHAPSMAPRAPCARAMTAAVTDPGRGRRGRGRCPHRRPGQRPRRALRARRAPGGHRRQPARPARADRRVERRAAGGTRATTGPAAPDRRGRTSLPRPAPPSPPPCADPVAGGCGRRLRACGDHHPRGRDPRSRSRGAGRGRGVRPAPGPRRSADAAPPAGPLGDLRRRDELPSPPGASGARRHAHRNASGGPACLAPGRLGRGPRRDRCGGPRRGRGTGQAARGSRGRRVGRGPRRRADARARGPGAAVVLSRRIQPGRGPSARDRPARPGGAPRRHRPVAAIGPPPAARSGGVEHPFPRRGVPDRVPGREHCRTPRSRTSPRPCDARRPHCCTTTWRSPPCTSATTRGPSGCTTCSSGRPARPARST